MLVESLLAISAFSLPWMNGPAATSATFSSTEHKDGVFVLETYQNHCGYCNDNVPNVEALAGFYAYEPRVQILDLGIDAAKRDYDQWISRHHPNHPVIMDGQRKVWDELQGSGTPTAYILDCHLAVKWQHVGEWDEDTVKEMKQKIDALLDATDCQ